MSINVTWVDGSKAINARHWSKRQSSWGSRVGSKRATKLRSWWRSESLLLNFLQINTLIYFLSPGVHVYFACVRNSSNLATRISVQWAQHCLHRCAGLHTDLDPASRFCIVIALWRATITEECDVFAGPPEVWANKPWLGSMSLKAFIKSDLCRVGATVGDGSKDWSLELRAEYDYTYGRRCLLVSCSVNENMVNCRILVTVRIERLSGCKTNW